MIPRAVCEEVFRAAVAACDPAVVVREALARAPIHGPYVRRSWSTFGIAIGKAALGMARGAGPVTRGVVVTNADDGRGVPANWDVMVSSHPRPDERSLAAGDAVLDLVASAGEGDVVLVLISGGASALVERPLPGITLDQIRDEIDALMARGAPIHEINRARIARSAIKGGKLAAMALAHVITLVISDVFDDDLAIVGSGPTAPPRPRTSLRVPDRLELVAPMRRLYELAIDDLGPRLDLRGLVFPLGSGALIADVGRIADEIGAEVARWDVGEAAFVGWGEPTVAVPSDHGEGGRAQQLALELAKRFRGTDRSAFVVGSDGIDGPPPRDRPAPAGAYVDGATWEAIGAAGLDPDAALARCDAGTALAAVGALVITGPTGINHADLVIVG